MTKYKFSADKYITEKMFWALVKYIIPGAGYDENATILFTDGNHYKVGDILDHKMVPSEKNPAKQRRDYKYLRQLNQVDAAALWDYLKSCPAKGTNNGPVESTQAVPVSGGVPKGLKPVK